MATRRFALIKQITSLDDLDGVDTSGASVGDTLVWDGSEWVPGDHGDLGGLTDDDHPQYALAARTLTAGAGLAGGGTLAADRTFDVGAGTGITVNANDVALDTTSSRNTDHASVTLTAGAGLTGGGDISASRTFDVGAGTGITVNANDVAISTDGVTNSLLDNMAQATIKGRAAGAGTGDPTDLSAAQVASIINSSIDHGTLAGLTDDDHTQYVLRSILTTDGDLFTRASGAVARLGIGTESYVLTVVSGAPAWAATAAGATGADPTASVGLSAVNGSATTFMRSDAAPPLSQAIAPTWTASHTWLQNTDAAITLTLDNDSNGASNAARWAVNSGDASAAWFVTGSGRTSVVITGGPVGAQSVLRTLGSYPLIFGTNNTYRGEISSAGQWLAVPLASAATPDFSFTTDANTGMYNVGADSLGLTTGGTVRVTVVSTGVTFAPVLLGPAGAVGAPSYSFSADPNTGLYNNGADALLVSTNGALRATFRAAGGLLLAAGSATAASWPSFTAGTLLTTAEDGTWELDNDALYFCTDAGNRGNVPVEHIIRADATRTFTSNTSQQAIFTTPAGGTLTLETGCYFFEAIIAMTAMSATSGNGKFSVIGAGTATLGAILWEAWGIDAAAEAAAAGFGGGWHTIATQTAADVVTAGTTTALCFCVRGTFEVTGAGTIIPSFAQTTAAAAVVSIGSYFRVRRVGSTSMTSIGQWT